MGIPTMSIRRSEAMAISATMAPGSPVLFARVAGRSYYRYGYGPVTYRAPEVLKVGSRAHAYAKLRQMTRG